MSETLLAFDVGARRIGVAVGNDLVRHAQPVRVVDVTEKDDGFAAIGKIVAEWGPQRLVVGMPTADVPNPSTKASQKRCDDFARAAQARFALPVERVDERYSSIDADAIHRERRGAGLARRTQALDAVAAQVILQRYLDALPTGGAAS